MAKNILAIGVVNDYEEVISSESKMSYIGGTITKENGSVINVTNDMIVPGSLYTTNQCSSGTGFEIGTVFAAEMGIALRLNDDKNSFYNAKIDLSYFVYKDPERVFQVRLGEFFVSEVKRNKTSITLKAYDNMLKLDGEIDEEFSGTIEEVLGFISRKCGVQVAEISLAALPNANVIIHVSPSYVKTYRELLAQICKITFTFAKISWGGTLTLVSYTSSPTKEISPKIKRSSLVSDFRVSFSKLTASFLIAEQETEMYYKTYENDDGKGNLEYSLGDITILRGDDAYNQAVVSVLFEKLKGISYIPCDISFTGDPALELGDMVTNVDMNGDKTDFYITFYKWSYRGNHDIKGAGSDPRTSGKKDKAAQMFEKVKEIVNIFNSKFIQTDEKIEGVVSKVEGQTIDITNLKLTAQGLSSEVSSIQIGGTNMLLNSSFAEDLESWEAAVNASIVDLGGVKCARIIGELGKTKTVQQDILSKIDVDNLDQEYVFSADVRVDNYVAGSTNPYVKLYFSGFDESNAWLGATQVKGDPDIPTQATGKWKRIYWVVKFAKKPTAMKAFMHARDFAGTLYFKNLKLEKGNKPTEWSPAPQDADAKYTSKTTFEQTSQGFEASIEDARKTATSFLEYTANEGVLVGYKNNLGAWVGNRAQIIPGAFNVLSNAGQLSSSFGDTLIELGKLSANALISMCAGKGLIRYGSDGKQFGVGIDDTLSLTSENVNLQGTNQASLYHQRLFDNGGEMQGYIHSVTADGWGISLSSSWCQALEKDSSGNWVGFWDGSTISVTPTSASMRAPSVGLNGDDVALYANQSHIFMYPNEDIIIDSSNPSTGEIQTNIPLCFYYSRGLGYWERVGAIHVNQVSGYMEFGGPSGYYFGGSVRASRHLYFGDVYTTEAGILSKWADNLEHYIVQRSSDGLVNSFGWAGSSTYPTTLVLRGQSCRLTNASGTVITSDERLKKDFEELDRWEGFFDSLKPCAFRLKDGRSGRFHLGFKAGDIKEALESNGLTTKDFAGYVEMKYEPLEDEDPARLEIYSEAGINPGDIELGLIYTELIALAIKEIQKIKKELKALINTKEEER